MSMRLGSDTGSLINHVMSGAKVPAPVVGMAATFLSWTDRSPGTVVKVEPQKNGTTLISVQADRAILVSGTTYDGSAAYRYEPNPEGHVSLFRITKDGSLEKVRVNPETGRLVRTQKGGLLLGHREEYRDPHF